MAHKLTYYIIGVANDDTCTLYHVLADNYEQAEWYVRHQYGALIAHFIGYAA